MPPRTLPNFLPRTQITTCSRKCPVNVTSTAKCESNQGTLETGPPNLPKLSVGAHRAPGGSCQGLVHALHPQGGGVGLGVQGGKGPQHPPPPLCILGQRSPTDFPDGQTRCPISPIASEREGGPVLPWLCLPGHNMNVQAPNSPVMTEKDYLYPSVQLQE